MTVTDASSPPVAFEATQEIAPALQSFSAKVESTDDASDLKSLGKPSSSDMLFYYERLLPFRQIFQWLNHSPKTTKDFTMREFAFEYRSGAYQRYNSFTGQDDFRKSVIKANPMRFEVGAVYLVNPKDRKNLPKLALKPVSKELVFDIDLTDYDDIRTCCLGTSICQKCWKFIQVATKIIDAALKQDFGFKHLIWIFSGRRGAHCWVSDQRARDLNEQTRRSIVEYLDLIGSTKHSKSGTKLNIKKPYHPHIERSYNILKSDFAAIIFLEQDPWNTHTTSDKVWESIDELLAFIPEKLLQDELRKTWQATPSTSAQKWKEIDTVAKHILKTKLQASQLVDAKKDIILYYLYPRLDMEVSKQVNHLLKSPFCIHPGTGNVCVPFDPLRNLDGDNANDAYGFNPMTAPNLSQLQTELDASEIDGLGAGRKLADFEKTSLKPYIDYFAKFVNGLVQEEIKGKRDREDELEF